MWTGRYTQLDLVMQAAPGFVGSRGKADDSSRQNPSRYAIGGRFEPVTQIRRERSGRTFGKIGNDVRSAWPIGSLDNVQKQK